VIQLPPIPDWDGLHPLIVHFPIALLLVAPLFVLIGVVLKEGRGRPYLVTALVLMLLGTAGTFVAISTGEAAAELADRVGAVKPTIEQHEELAETTRLVFTALTAVFATILVLPPFFAKTPRPMLSRVLPSVFLVFYSAGALLLVATAHQGGRLVHELGVRAMIASSGAAAQALPVVERED
jgi:uncharacterized membrane protein